MVLNSNIFPTIESATDPIFLDPATGFRRKIVLAKFSLDNEAPVTQRKFIYVPEMLVYEGTPNEQTLPARHIETVSQKLGRVYVEYRCYYYKNEVVDPETQEVSEGYGEYINSRAIQQGQLFSFSVTDATWVDAATGQVVTNILLEDEDGLIEEPYAGLLGELERFGLAVSNGVSIIDAITQGALNALNNGRFN